MTTIAWSRCHVRTAVGFRFHRRAAEALAGAYERRQRGRRASKPTFTSPTITYDPRSVTLFDDGTVSLATVEERVRCLVLPADDDGYRWQYVDDSWELAESTLTVGDDDYSLHLGFRSPVSTDAAENGDGEPGVQPVPVRRDRGREHRRLVQSRTGLASTGTARASTSSAGWHSSNRPSRWRRRRPSTNPDRDE